jgi:hypothetical protein
MPSSTEHNNEDLTKQTYVTRSTLVNGLGDCIYRFSNRIQRQSCERMDSGGAVHHGYNCLALSIAEIHGYLLLVKILLGVAIRYFAG